MRTGDDVTDSFDCVWDGTTSNSDQDNIPTKNCLWSNCNDRTDDQSARTLSSVARHSKKRIKGNDTDNIYQLAGWRHLRC